MNLKARIPELLALMAKHDAYLTHNKVLFEILQGKLLPHVEAEVRAQLSEGALKQALARIPPINTLKRVIDKQSKIYTQGVSRSIEHGTESDDQVLAWYEDRMNPSRRLATANRYFNLFKCALIWPYLKSNKMPALRIVPADRFIPYSTNHDEPETIGGAVLIIGWATNGKGESVKVYQAIEPDEYVYFTSDGEDVTAAYAPANDPNPGVSTLGRLPFVYVNRDDACLVPEIDTDIYAMTVLLCVLLTDINFAHMFQAFAIMYGINCTDQGLKFAPNAFWSFKSEPGSDKQPEVGTLKAEADITAGLELVANQFALWLNSKGIKPGAIGEINGTNFSSGISKMLDEMDTSEDRAEQVPYFADAEVELWDLVLHTLHPRWVSEGIDMTTLVTSSSKVVANFAEQVPLVRRGAIVEEQNKELTYGFTTWERAIKRINPLMTDSDVAALRLAIDEEKAAKEPPPPPAPLKAVDDGGAA